jgi:DNA polymerase-3 subunit delta'
VRLEDLVGQSRAVAVLRSAIRRNRVTHAYLFHGPEGVGKSTAALLFAQALNCTNRGGDDGASGCGECDSCRFIAARSHPDVRFLTPVGKRENSVVPIADIRDFLVYDAQLKPVMGGRKIYILDPAERTAPLAIHTVLKVLEEPPPPVVTILVTARPALLPSTIPSRCQQVAFQVAGAAAIEGHLLALGVEPAAASSLATLSGGRVAWAIRAAQRPEVLSARKALLDLCAGTESLGLPAGLRLAEEIKLQAMALARAEAEAESGDDGGDSEDGEDVEDAPSARTPVSSRAVRAELPWCLDVMVSWYRDLLATGQGGQAPLMNPDYQPMLEAAATSLAPRQAERAIEEILETRHSIQRNANVDLALESLAVALLSAGA